MHAPDCYSCRPHSLPADPERRAWWWGVAGQGPLGLAQVWGDAALPSACPHHLQVHLWVARGSSHTVSECPSVWCTRGVYFRCVFLCGVPLVCPPLLQVCPSMVYSWCVLLWWTPFCCVHPFVAYLCLCPSVVSSRGVLLSRRDACACCALHILQHAARCTSCNMLRAAHPATCCALHILQHAVRCTSCNMLRAAHPATCCCLRSGSGSSSSSCSSEAAAAAAPALVWWQCQSILPTGGASEAAAAAAAAATPDPVCWQYQRNSSLKGAFAAIAAIAAATPNLVCGQYHTG
eukprot:1160735-Pelagomonas_calceolata.AAC.2